MFFWGEKEWLVELKMIGSKWEEGEFSRGVGGGDGEEWFGYNNVVNVFI